MVRPGAVGLAAAAALAAGCVLLLVAQSPPALVSFDKKQAPPSAADDDGALVAGLERLAKLKEGGLLSQAEFTAAKQHLLAAPVATEQPAPTRHVQLAALVHTAKKQPAPAHHVQPAAMTSLDSKAAAPSAKPSATPDRTAKGWYVPSAMNLDHFGNPFKPQSAARVRPDTAEMANAVATHIGVKYAEDSPNQVLNFWQAPGEGRRPLVVHIHGGGWMGGDYSENKPHGFINQGISFASVDYRRLSESPLPAPVLDAARALQFLRHNAKKYNIEPTKIILSGQSAGGASALYLNYHDDLADPASDDPIARESTRVLATFTKSAQSCIDPKVLKTCDQAIALATSSLKWGMGPEVLTHRMITDSVGAKPGGLKDAQKALYKEYSAINHVDANDPPVYLTVDGDETIPCVTNCIHHAVFGMHLKTAADAAGAVVYLEHQGHQPWRVANTPTVNRTKMRAEFVPKLEMPQLSVSEKSDGLTGKERSAAHGRAMAAKLLQKAGTSLTSEGKDGLTSKDLAAANAAASVDAALAAADAALAAEQAAELDSDGLSPEERKLVNDATAPTAATAPANTTAPAAATANATAPAAEPAAELDSDGLSPEERNMISAAQQNLNTKPNEKVPASKAHASSSATSSGRFPQYRNTMQFIAHELGLDYEGMKKADTTNDWCGKSVITWLC